MKPIYEPKPKLYDEPKSITDFKVGDACPYLTKEGCSYKFHCFRAGQLKRCGDYLDKPLKVIFTKKDLHALIKTCLSEFSTERPLRVPVHYANRRRIDHAE